jgi:hypothetical protein
VTLVPFSTALLAHFPTLKVALVEYWLNIVLLGGTLLAAVEYALRAHLLKRQSNAAGALVQRADPDRTGALRDCHRSLDLLSDVGEHRFNRAHPAELRDRPSDSDPATVLTDSSA